MHRGDAKTAERELDKTTEEIIGTARQMHGTLGLRPLESTREECLCHELSLPGIPPEPEWAVPLEDAATGLDGGYRAHLVVPGAIVVQIRAVEAMDSIPEAELLTYLKPDARRLGVLINRNLPVRKYEIHRRIL